MAGDPKGPVGLPRALYYFSYHPLWKTYLEGLGLEVLVSPPTNREILELGLRGCVEGACLPVKACLGHARYLAGQGIRRLFLPQLISMEPRTFTCPAILGLPDLLKQYLPQGVELLSPALDGFGGRHKLNRDYLRFGRSYAPRRRVKQAWQKALDQQSAFESTQGERVPPAQPTVLVLGPRYLVEDQYLNGEISKNLQSLGVRALTPAQFGCSAQPFTPPGARKPLFWSEPRRSLAALAESEGLIQGVVALAPFACGAEALLSVFVQEHSAARGLPLLELCLDEHSSALGVRTRLEAFCDLLERRAR